MAMISAFSKLVLLFITAHVSSAVNSPVPVVHTVSSVTLISGKEGTLTCKYNRTVYAVKWRYESTTSPMELLVALDKYYEDGKRSGPGYDEGRFDMTDDFSLIIHDVQTTNEGKYICEVSDYETGSVFRNHTDVTTVLIAERPFVRIEQCEKDVSADEINEPCILHTSSEDRTVQLTCTVVGVKPLVDLTWEASMSSEQWKQVMNESTLTKKDRGDGIFDQTLTVIVDTSYIKSNKQLFTCFGRGLAVDGLANRTIAVYHPKVSDVTWTVVAVVISVVCTLLFTFVIIGVWWKMRDKRPSLKAMVNTIKRMKADERVYLGVLGDLSAGKSSFIESIKRLIQEKDGSTRLEPHNSSQMWECTVVISEGLRIRKQRNGLTIKPEDISAVLMPKEEGNPTTRHDMSMESDDQIHYPIFVFDISNTDDYDKRKESLKYLSEKVHKRIMQYPMIVLTKASTEQNEDTLIEEFITTTGIPRENILVTFQFSDPSAPIDKHTRFEQLDFILKCVAKVDIQKKSIKKRLPRRHGRKRNYDLAPSNDT